MSSEDPTPPQGRPTPQSPPSSADGDAAPDPLWAPTGAQRGETTRPAMPFGTPSPQREPARAPYGNATGAAASAGSPTMAMPSTDVPRVGTGPVVAQPVMYEARPVDVPVAVESTVVGPPPRKPVWPWVVAVLGVVLGGLIGWLLSRSDDDEDAVTDDTDVTVVVSTVPADAGIDEQLDALVEQTRANGAYADGSGFPQIDEIVAIDRAATSAQLQDQVDLLSIAQEQSVEKITELEEQVTMLEASLAEVTAERDELKAQAASGAVTDTEFLARLQEKEDEIATLEDQLATATTQVTEAQAAAQRATEDLRVAQADLQEANATLDALDPMQIESYINSNIDRIRADASANGWVLVEQPVDASSATPNIITNQLPAAGATVVRGSVVIVEYDRT